MLRDVDLPELFFSFLREGDMVSLYHCPGIAGYLISYITNSLLWMSFIGRLHFPESILDTRWIRRSCWYPSLPADGGWGVRVESVN